MKTKVAFLLGITLLAPLVVAAQTPQGGGPDFSAMRGMMEQTRTIRANERTHVLGLLSAKQRAYIASIVGALAIASTPDPKGAVVKLDAQLSSRQKQAILSADSSARTQMQTLRQQTFGNSGWGGRGGGRRMDGNDNHTPDAGEILLDLTGFRPDGGGPGFMRG